MGSIVGTIQSKSLDCQCISERPRPWPSTISLDIGRRKLFFSRRLTRTKPKPFRPHIGVSRSLLDDAPNYHRTKASWNRMRDFPVMQGLDRHTRNFCVRRRSPGPTHHLPGLGAGTRSRRDPRTGRGFLAGTPPHRRTRHRDLRDQLAACRTFQRQRLTRAWEFGEIFGQAGEHAARSFSLWRKRKDKIEFGKAKSVSESCQPALLISIVTLRCCCRRT